MDPQKPSSRKSPPARDIPVPASVVPRNPPGAAPVTDPRDDPPRKQAVSPLAPRPGEASPPIEGS